MIVAPQRTPLEVTEVALDGSDGAEQLRQQFDPRQHRIDLGRAPLLRFVIAREPGSARWLLLELLHHLIGDHSTLEVMHAEVRAELEGRAHELTAPQPFRNLVAQARLGVGAQEHEQFFRRLLADIDEPTLPFGLSEVRGDGSGAGAARRMLPRELNERLRVQARRLGVSLASLCHLAWGQVVARSSGREQVVFGTVLFGRMHGGAGADRAMGLFINTLPLRLDLDGTGVEASVRITHRRLAELLAHEHASLALAQRCSSVAAPAPLFSALLNYRHNTPAPSSGPDDVLSGVEWLGAEERTNYPLTLSVEDFGEALGLTAQVAAPISADRVCGYMQRALEQLAEALEHAPNKPVRELDILPADERAYLLEELNRTAAAYPSERCIHELFEAQVAKTPDAVAVVCADERLSYGELNARANRLAHHLIALGVTPGDRLATMLDRSVVLVVAQLAILKAGGVYVPIDRSLPPARQSWMMADCAARLVLTNSDDDLVEVTIPVLPIEPLMTGAGLSTDPGLALTAEAAAYVMYTSGSTGLPKGVVVPHRAVNRLVINNGYAQFNASDRVAWVGNPAFDISTLEVWAPLLHGSSLIVIPYTDALQPGVLRGLVQQHRISVLHLTAGLFNQSAADLGPVPASLRLLLVGGDAVDVAAVARILSQSRPQHLLHCYGPTETTTFATVCEITAIDETLQRLPIGRPIANTRVYLLDGHGAPVPLGAVGELYIGGAGVARGYLNRPELTAERFLADPFSGEVGARMYRTGDLARYLPDGNLEFLGRIDDQMKIRGFRIEPGEIAARLVEHASVRDAAVVACEDRSGEKRLVAYVVTAAEHAGEAEGTELAGTLRTHLGARLPEYMVPSAFVRLAALPLTPNGKLDRKALPPPEDDAYARAAYEAPRGEIEIALAQIWAELLGLERVGRHDNFFELGGHSLLALQVLEQLRRRGLTLELSAHIASPRLDQCAEKVRSRSKDGRKSAGQLISLRVAKSRPLILCHARGGGLSIYDDLVRALPPTQNIYGIHALNFGHELARVRSIDEIAEVYARAILPVLPDMACTLAGWSFGGVLAHAVAGVLISAHVRVDFVAMIDSAYPSVLEAPLSLSMDQEWSEFLIFLAEEGGLSPQHGATTEIRPADFAALALALSGAWKIGAPALEEIFQVFVRHIRAGRLYVPKTVSALGVSYNQNSANTATSWRAVFDSVIEAPPLPGDHRSLLKHPNVVVLADDLSNRLFADAVLHSSAIE